MKKCYAFLAVALVAFAMASGCSGFKGFCDRGSLFPTRQPQLVPTQTMYSMSSDVCYPSSVMMPPCDPCASVGSSEIFSGPTVRY